MGATVLVATGVDDGTVVAVGTRAIRTRSGVETGVSLSARSSADASSMRAWLSGRNRAPVESRE